MDSFHSRIWRALTAYACEHVANRFLPKWSLDRLVVALSGNRCDPLEGRLLGLKPVLILHTLHGAEAPLFHGAARVLGCCRTGESPVPTRVVLIAWGSQDGRKRGAVPFGGLRASSAGLVPASSSTPHLCAGLLYAAPAGAGAWWFWPHCRPGFRFSGPGSSLGSRNARRRGGGAGNGDR